MRVGSVFVARQGKADGLAHLALRNTAGASKR
jgi:hypothetical protein